ncbi:kinase-like protein [Ramaria rubella]|nr:kinase-like protein [Ramaria rubella]
MLAVSASNNIHDLTSEVELLGEFPVHVGLDYSVWPGKLGESTEVAIKLLRPARSADIQEDLSEEFVREAVLWSRAMQHENVMPLLGIARLDESVAFVSPWMEEGDLTSYLKTHQNAHVEQLFTDVAHGLAHVHRCGIVYGILRASTILVSTTGRARLSSFLVAHTDASADYGPTRTLNWRTDSLTVSQDSPPGSRKITTTLESDVFAFGALIMEILMDRNFSGTPYSRRNLSLPKRNLEGEPERPQSLEGLADGLWDVVLSCWRRDPKRRPTMDTVAEMMAQLSLTAKSRTPTSDRISLEVFIPEHDKTSPLTLRDISTEIRRLGEHPIAGGGFCDLYLGERLGLEQVALKLVRFYGRTEQDRKTARRRFLSEAWLWAGFKHPRILQFYGVCHHGDRAYFMVSPYLKNGNVIDYLTNIDPDANRRQLLLEAAEGLLYLHSRHPPVVHGDMKGANILITDSGTAVVADFGLSKISQEATTTVLQGAGSPRWMAPELFSSGDGLSKTTMSDVYAFGHVMLEIYSNQLPFFDVREDLHVLFGLTRGARSLRPNGPLADRWLDDEAWEFSRRCTAIEPEDRPDMAGVVSKLSSPK